MTTVEPRPVGALLREWRERRRLSQLQLSLDADISARHLSFVETGRSKPTKEMILRLSEQLDVPLRERNGLLLAGGYAPAYPNGSLDAPELAAVLAALRQVLAGHEPNPALVVDRHWHLIDGNDSAGLFLDGAAAELLAPPVNVLRLSLHPAGLAPNIVNLGEWRAHVLGRLHRQAAATGDPVLRDLHAELRDYPCDQPEPEVELPGAGDVVVPLRFRRGGAELSFFSTTTVFGTPLDVTVAELAIESFFPADRSTMDFLRNR
ncbi:helix-turn-helix transcriptional regulator [Saccharopolyspora indica]|uniref:helix-turn-helix domain-containing protein n=1 Tax=Saccharopolyspora indica TaxID=1229659 RepID=UPI0022EB10F1|nr:helix-turn-helix transcriptional regulator [Saccharopolyspora indica]MDA3644929.1 helix-turn-helix transcriptional regulator [Saccharopolyspora indica]